MSCPMPTAVGMSRKTARPVAAATSTGSRMPSMPDARSARTKAPSSTSTARTGRSRTRTATGTTRIRRRGDARANSIPVMGTEPASENWIRSCCGSSPGIRFYCKPVTLVLCREIRGEIRFSGRVVGKWLCEITSAFIIKELRGARALRLFCGRSAFPPPRHSPGRSSQRQKPVRNSGFFVVCCPRMCYKTYYNLTNLGVYFSKIPPVKNWIPPKLIFYALGDFDYAAQ